MELDDLLDEARGFADDLVAWRREIHQIPETDLTLPQTSAFVQKTLDGMGVPYKTLVDGSCVVAQLGEGSPCILLRADMDALPIHEESGLPFASENGCMHACGHDMHATGLLGAAKLLKAHESELKGTVKMIFQPGEETFRGAQAAIDDGVMEDPHVDVAFGSHVFAAIPVGEIRFGGQAMAGVYGFRITVTGAGCHGSSPELGVDPVVAASHVVIALQELLAREIPAADEAALTVGVFKAEGAFNVIPGKAVLEGSLRAFDPDVRDFLIKRIGEVATSVAATYRATAEVDGFVSVPPLVNDEAVLQSCLGYMEKALPGVAFVDGVHSMGSEDFALYSEKVPAAFVMVGAQDPTAESTAQHNSRVRFNEEALPTSSAAYAAVALGWLADHAE